MSFRLLPTWLERQPGCSKAKAYKGQNTLYGHACAAFSITLLHRVCSSIHADVGTSKQNYSVDMPRERVKRAHHPCNIMADTKPSAGLVQACCLESSQCTVCDLPKIVSRTHAAEKGKAERQDDPHRHTGLLQYLVPPRDTCRRPLTDQSTSLASATECIYRAYRRQYRRLTEVGSDQAAVHGSEDSAKVQGSYASKLAATINVRSCRFQRASKQSFAADCVR